MKFAGYVGFWLKDVETKPGLFENKLIEKFYTGDVTRAYNKWADRDDSTNQELSLNNQISILADLFAQENWPSILYVRWNGKPWEVKTVGVSFPRLTLEIGGVWNGEPGQSSEAAGTSGVS